MDLITRSQGLRHIAEQIFLNLDKNDLLRCQEVNEYWASILRDPWLWYRKKIQNTKLTQEHQKEWMNSCERLSTLNLTKDITSGLNFIYERLEKSGTLNGTYWSAVSKHSSLFSTQKRCTEIVKILAPLTENPNAPDRLGNTPISVAACKGHTEIVKILATLTDNPIAPNKYGETPIHLAALNGHTEIVKILAPLTDNPNAPNKSGYTPIHWAAQNGHTEIVKILKPFHDLQNYNAGASRKPYKKRAKKF